MPEVEDPMRQRLRGRMEDLRLEYARGETQLAELETRKQEVSRMMARIAGAIRVLQEELGET